MIWSYDATMFDWSRLVHPGLTAERWHGRHWDTTPVYRWFVADAAKQVFGDDEEWYYQAEPNLRIQRPDDVAVPWHTDADFGHLPDEWNVWVPLTEIVDESQTIWLDEGVPEPQMVKPGQALIFPGARTHHGNRPNTTNETRYSFDFRLIAKADFHDQDAKTVVYGVPLKLGAYWRAP